MQWTAGLTDARLPGIQAGSAPNTWKPLPGYTWVQPNSAQNLAVLWKAGLPHPSASNVVSSSKEGVWQPISGYKWANDHAEDLTVVRAGPSQAQQDAALAKVIVALLADKARVRSDDGSFVGAIFSETFRGVRNEAIRSALSDLLPNESPLAIAAAANIIILGADGELTADNWTSRNSQDAIVRRIRAEDPSVADAFLLAEFIGNVMGAYDNGD